MVLSSSPFRVLIRCMPMLTLVILCVAFFGAHTVLEDGPDQAKPAMIEATYMYNFTKYVHWPTDRHPHLHAPLVIGVLNDSLLHGSISKTTNGKRIDRHPIDVRSSEGLPDEVLMKFIAQCHVLVIGKSERSRLEMLLKCAHENNILTISSMDDFAKQGGMIGLLLKNNKIVFEVNHDVVRMTELKINARMLKLARIVKTKPRASTDQRPPRDTP